MKKMLGAVAVIFLLLVVIGVLIGCNGDDENGEMADDGLGIHAFDVKDPFAADLRFQFEQAPLKDGTPRMMGSSPDNLATLELVGPVHKLSKIVLTLGLAEGAGDTLAAYAVFLIIQAFPDWGEGVEWLETGVGAILSGEKDLVETSHGNANIEMKGSEVLPFFFITISEQ